MAIEDSAQQNTQQGPVGHSENLATEQQTEHQIPGATQAATQTTAVADVTQEGPHAHLPAGNQHLEVDLEDNDSALGENSSTYTESLRSSLLHSVSENGRGYHKYRDGQYMLPEDQQEQERLDMQHQMFLNTFGGKLSLAPPSKKLHNVLDVGTGTGIWAIDFADQHPETTVLGIDLSPIQPSYTPPNCKFEVDNYEETWTYTQKFDLVHGRMLLTSIADPHKLFKQAFDSLEPGGWFEMQELDMPWPADDGTDQGTAYKEWNDIFIDTCQKAGRDPTWAKHYKEFMEGQGFVNVTSILFKWPQNAWPKDKEMKDLGRWNMINTLEGISGFTMRLFTRTLGWSSEEVDILLGRVRRDIQSRKIHTYWPIYVVYGQKPQNPEA